MSAKTLIRQAMAKKDVKVGELAQSVGMTGQPLSTKLYRDTMKFSFVVQIADVLGYNVVFEDKETGEILR